MPKTEVGGSKPDCKKLQSSLMELPKSSKKQGRCFDENRRNPKATRGRLRLAADIAKMTLLPPIGLLKFCDARCKRPMQMASQGPRGLPTSAGMWRLALTASGPPTLCCLGIGFEPARPTVEAHTKSGILLFLLALRALPKAHCDSGTCKCNKGRV